MTHPSELRGQSWCLWQESLWLLDFSRWGQGSPVRSAWEKGGRKGWEERRWPFWTRGSSCHRLHLHTEAGFSSQMQLPTQTPTLRFTHSLMELSLTTAAMSDPTWKPFPLPQAERGRNYGKTKTKTKLLSREKLGWGAGDSFVSPFLGV